MKEASEEQVAALRERIRRAGAFTRWLRTGLRGAVAILLVWILTRPIPVPEAPIAWDYGQALYSLFLVSSILLVEESLCGFLVARPVAAVSRGFFELSIANRLVGLSRKQAAQVLLPLRADGGDTHKIVEPLIRKLRLPTELIPSDAPAGRGDEAAPTS
jgi:hypothetical protein